MPYFPSVCGRGWVASVEIVAEGCLFYNYKAYRSFLAAVLQALFGSLLRRLQGEHPFLAEKCVMYQERLRECSRVFYQIEKGNLKERWSELEDALCKMIFMRRHAAFFGHEQRT